VHDGFLVRGAGVVVALHLGVDEPHIVERVADLAVQRLRPVDRQTGSIVVERGRQVAAHARDHAKVLRDHRFELAVLDVHGQRQRPSVHRLGRVEVAAHEVRVSDRVDGVGDVLVRAARFGDRQRGGETIERRLDLTLVEIRTGDATDD
jgi:hypothetical protein